MQITVKHGVHSPCQIRNTQSVSTMLGVNEVGRGDHFLWTVHVGHTSLPVYTIACEWDPGSAGETLATTVWHLDNRGGVKRLSIVVLISMKKYT